MLDGEKRWTRRCKQQESERSSNRQRKSKGVKSDSSLVRADTEVVLVVEVLDGRLSSMVRFLRSGDLRSDDGGHGSVRADPAQRVLSVANAVAACNPHNTTQQQQ